MVPVLKEPSGSPIVTVNGVAAPPMTIGVALSSVTEVIPTPDGEVDDWSTAAGPSAGARWSLQAPRNITVESRAAPAARIEMDGMDGFQMEVGWTGARAT
jgi:hypothetical protein